MLLGVTFPHKRGLGGGRVPTGILILCSAPHDPKGAPAEVQEQIGGLRQWIPYGSGPALGTFLERTLDTPGSAPAHCCLRA